LAHALTQRQLVRDMRMQQVLTTCTINPSILSLTVCRSKSLGARADAAAAGARHAAGADDMHHHPINPAFVCMQV
jgi:hypothetical protein